MAFLAGFPLFGGPALAGARRPRNFRFRGEMTDMIDEEELKARYRFSKNSIEFIVDLISEDIERDTKRNKALLPFTRVVGDTIGVDNSTVSRVIHRVAEALSSGFTPAGAGVEFVFTIRSDRLLWDTSDLALGQLIQG